MKKILIIAIMALTCSATTFAQGKVEEVLKKSQEELVKERKENLKLAEDAIKSKAMKLAKKQAKELKKQGWKAAAGSLTIEQQLTDVYIKSHLLEKNFPQYIIGRSTASSSSYGVARKQALARARVDIVTQMKAEIAGLTEVTDSNIELSEGEVETVAKMVDTSQTLFQQNLGKTDVILDIYREVDNKTEAMVIVSYDGKIAKQALLDMFEQDRAEIKQKLQELLGK